jgi:hypothetical protein
MRQQLQRRGCYCSTFLILLSLAASTAWTLEKVTTQQRISLLHSSHRDDSPTAQIPWLRRILKIVTTSEDDGPQDDNGPKEKQRQNLSGGTNKVVYREPPELGGVPRSDRYSSRDWLHNTITLPNSAILRDIRSPVLAISGWATFLSLLHLKLMQTAPEKAALLYLPSTPHSLMMSALGLLLVFRTNSAYQRFAEGRKIWETIVNSARDLYRMTMLYEQQIGIDKRRRLQRLLAAFPYLLRHRIRPNLVMHRLDDEEHERDPENTILLYQDMGPTDNDAEAAVVARAEEETGKGRRKKRPLYWVDKRTLPWRLLPADALEKCAQAQNRPLWVCTFKSFGMCSHEIVLGSSKTRHNFVFNLFRSAIAWLRSVGRFRMDQTFQRGNA